MKPSERLACITLDLEEDHAGLSAGPAQYEALPLLSELAHNLKEKNIPLSIFVAGNFLQNKSKAIESLQFLDYHSHGYWHPPLNTAGDDTVRRANMEKGLTIFKEFFKRTPLGYRAAYGIHKPADLSYLHSQGVKFDSSLFPSVHVSGVRPWVTSSPKLISPQGMIEFPISSLFALRTPYNLSYMKLIGAAPYRFMANLGLAANPLIFDLHLHDLVETTAAGQMSPMFRRIYGRTDKARTAAMFHDWLRLIQDKGYTFVTMEQLYRKYQTQWGVS